MQSFIRFIEKYSFGVCSYIGEKIGMSDARIRLYFVYASLVAFGSPMIIYLATAFWLNLKKQFRRLASYSLG